MRVPPACRDVQVPSSPDARPHATSSRCCQSLPNRCHAVPDIAQALVAECRSKPTALTAQRKPFRLTGAHGGRSHSRVRQPDQINRIHEVSIERSIRRAEARAALPRRVCRRTRRDCHSRHTSPASVRFDGVARRFRGVANATRAVHASSRQERGTSRGITSPNVRVLCPPVTWCAAELSRAVARAACAHAPVAPPEAAMRCDRPTLASARAHARLPRAAVSQSAPSATCQLARVAYLAPQLIPRVAHVRVTSPSVSWQAAPATIHAAPVTSLDLAVALRSPCEPEQDPHVISRLESRPLANP